MIETKFIHNCSKCKETLTLYHLNWSAIQCKFCKHEIPIKEIKNDNTEIVTSIYKNGNWTIINK